MLASDRFYEPVQIEGGPRTRAIIQRPSDKDQPGAEFSFPRLVARAHRSTVIRPGDVLALADGGRYLVAQHSGMGTYRTFHLFRADRVVPWFRPTTNIHPISKQPVAANPLNMGAIWVMWQRIRREYADLPIRFSQESTLTACGAAVEIGDLLDGQKVTRLSHALGVRVLEVQA